MGANKSLDSPDSQHYSGDSDVIDEEVGSKKSDITSVSEAIEAKLDEAQSENIIETDIGAAGEQIESPQSLSKTSDGPDDILDEDMTQNGSTKAAEDEVIDIDLADPAVEAAATKIQSVFKGYKARKKISQM